MFHELFARGRQGVGFGGGRVLQEAVERGDDAGGDVVDPEERAGAGVRGGRVQGEGVDVVEVGKEDGGFVEHSFVAVALRCSRLLRSMSCAVLGGALCIIRLGLICG